MCFSVAWACSLLKCHDRKHLQSYSDLTWHTLRSVVLQVHWMQCLLMPWNLTHTLLRLFRPSREAAKAKSLKLVICIMDITLASITIIINEPLFRTYINGMQKSYAWSEGTNQIWTSHIPVSGMESCCSFQTYFFHSLLPHALETYCWTVRLSCKLTGILNSSSARDLALLGNWDSHLAYLGIR